MMPDAAMHEPEAEQPPPGHTPAASTARAVEEHRRDEKAADTRLRAFSSGLRSGDSGVRPSVRPV